MRSGFTIIRNGESLGYPYLESLRSLAPVVDEIVIAVGDSQDGTTAALEKLGQELPCPLRLLNSPWDAQNLKGGFELSRQTNLALAACAHDICFYLQGDEVLNDSEYSILREDLDRFEQDSQVDALALRWKHFYGNFDHVVYSKAWYRREIRVLKKSRGLLSFSDAQGFRKLEMGRWTKVPAALSRAHVHHYGWVRPPQVMAKKSEALDRLWHGSDRDGSHHAESIYAPQFGLQKYTGSHPTFMRERIENLGDFNPFSSPKFLWNLRNVKLALSATLETLSGGFRMGEFKNYSTLKAY